MNISYSKKILLQHAQDAVGGRAGKRHKLTGGGWNGGFVDGGFLEPQNDAGPHCGVENLPMMVSRSASGGCRSLEPEFLGSLVKEAKVENHLKFEGIKTADFGGTVRWLASNRSLT
ncbi:MAG: hypothetical protein VYE18_02545 [Pseudomonadota bacterium]|nr:hypothetical protein [Pseudomonadota bacterium]